MIILFKTTTRDKLFIIPRLARKGLKCYRSTSSIFLIGTDPIRPLSWCQRLGVHNVLTNHVILHTYVNDAYANAICNKGNVTDTVNGHL